MLPEKNSFIETLFHSNESKVKRYAVTILKDKYRAEEAVQITFLEAINHVDTLMAHPKPEYWLLLTLKHKIMHSERSRIRDQRRFLSLDAEECAPLAAPICLEEQVEGQETGTGSTFSTVKIIQKCLTPEELNHIKRLILDKATHLEVAEELGISVWTSQKRLERIRKKLRKVFPVR